MMVLKRVRLLVLIGLFSLYHVMVRAESADIKIVEVRHQIALAPGEQVYRDFYLNGGSAHGVTQGKTFLVYRKVPINNVLSRGPVGFISIPVGELKVIWQSDQIAVARQTKVYDRADLPVLEVPGILVGDLIDVKGQITLPKEVKRSK